MNFNGEMESHLAELMTERGPRGLAFRGRGRLRCCRRGRRRGLSLEKVRQRKRSRRPGETSFGDPVGLAKARLGVTADELAEKAPGGAPRRRWTHRRPGT